MKVVNGKRQAALFTTEVEGPFAVVVFNGPVEAELSYRIPERLAGRVRPGQRVRVPLGRANAVSVGYCVRVEETAEVEPGRVKDVLDALDDPPLIGVKILELTRWMAAYYACSWGQALEAALPAGVKKQAGTRLGTFLVVPEEVRASLPTLSLPPKQTEILAILSQSTVPLSVADVCRLAHCTTGPIAALKTRGLIHTLRRRISRLPMPAAFEMADEPPAPVLTGEQREVLDKVSASIDAGGFSAFVLHGVTGSGKTEVYLSAIEHVVAQGREAIVLVPEISLTPQTIRRFQRRIPRVAVLHSHLSDAERHHHWRSIASGEVPVVVGARSAVFAPARKLGLIVVDEEHESTFKQETAPRYHGRDVAVKRAQLEGVPIVLGSATPALETWHNVERGRYTRLELPRRVNNRPMPRVQLIDLRHEKPESGKPSGALSPTLRTAM
ncbi:MAG TPA: primosomal protein N', partial [Isosphaeraceae bacterium]|nr:primosomal protein N' [Isosphaeraceae bacterium]